MASPAAAAVVAVASRARDDINFYLQDGREGEGAGKGRWVGVGTLFQPWTRRWVRTSPQVPWTRGVNIKALMAGDVRVEEEREGDKKAASPPLFPRPLQEAGYHIQTLPWCTVCWQLGTAPPGYVFPYKVHHGVKAPLRL